jgi:NAD(P)-dependent dehydrogenase (short-subunit alcohol dehydrogenase family)
VVTGGAGGIGTDICRELAAEGAAVAVWDLDGDRAEALAATIPRARAYRVDITDSADVDRATAQVRDDHGSIDTLINNAGISKVGDHTHELSDEIWNESIGVMQTGVFFCSRAVGRVMIDQGRGTVVNISSIRGYSPNPGRMTYCAPKAAVIMMTKIAAGEWAQFGVRCNAIAPGVLRTPMWDADVERGAIDEEFYLDMVPAKRLGMPSEVGALAVYLGSDDASYVNGSIIPIDGALTAIPAG